MARGRLYNTLSEEFVGEVEYQFFSNGDVGWWGELIFTRYCKVKDGDNYALELADRRRGSCSLRKKLNKAVSGIPPLFYYRFQGSGRFNNITE
jgi:hypothetical protein